VTPSSRRLPPLPVEDVIPSRCEPLDALLGGGFTVGEVVVVYGEARTGKTTLAIQTAIEAARRGSKVVYLDTDHSFTHQRFTQLAGEDIESVSKQILLFFPDTFSEQTSLIESIENYLTTSTQLIVADTITSLYRVGLGKAEQTFSLNRELNRQLAYLSEVAVRRKLVVLLTSQVHARLDFPFGRIEPVARRTLIHWPRTIIRLKNTADASRKEIIVERRRGRQTASLRCPARLTVHGFEPV
jgi:DNA repair protein RadB